ncbi:MAG: RNA polymerase sigma factor [Myxococcota bacterium]
MVVTSGSEARSDVELIERTAKGDAQALGELYQRHGRMTHGLLRAWAPELPGAEIEDLCQDVFMTVWSHASRYREQGNLKGWICGIARHKLRNVRRRGRFRLARLAMLLHEPTTNGSTGAFEDKIELRREADRTAAALTTLSADHREVVLLCVVEGLDTASIARTLGISRATVATRLFRARQVLRRQLVGAPLSIFAQQEEP